MTNRNAMKLRDTGQRREKSLDFAVPLFLFFSFAICVWLIASRHALSTRSASFPAEGRASITVKIPWMIDEPTEKESDGGKMTGRSSTKHRPRFRRRWKIQSRMTREPRRIECKFDATFGHRLVEVYCVHRVIPSASMCVPSCTPPFLHSFSTVLWRVSLELISR